MSDIDERSVNHRAKLARAKEHLIAFRALLHVHARGATSLTSGFDPQSRDFLILLRIEKPIPLSWSVTIGDILHNLRSALDNLLYAISLKHSGEPTPAQARQLQFPIADNPAQFEEQRARHLKRVLPATQAEIERVQTYDRRWNGWNPLPLLRDLNNIDKHRSIVLTYVNLHSGTVRIRRHYGSPAFEVEVPMKTGILEDGIIVARCNLPLDVPAVDVSMSSASYGLNFTFADDVPTNGIALPFILDTLDAFVGDQVKWLERHLA